MTRRKTVKTSLTCQIRRDPTAPSGRRLSKSQLLTPFHDGYGIVWCYGQSSNISIFVNSLMHQDRANRFLQDKGNQQMLKQRRRNDQERISLFGMWTIHVSSQFLHLHFPGDTGPHFRISSWFIQWTYSPPPACGDGCMWRSKGEFGSDELQLEATTCSWGSTQVFDSSKVSLRWLVSLTFREVVLNRITVDEGFPPICVRSRRRNCGHIPPWLGPRVLQTRNVSENPINCRPNADEPDDLPQSFRI